MSLDDDKCTFFLDKLLKHSKPGTHLKRIEFRAYPPDPKLCVVLCLKAYLKVAADIRRYYSCSKCEIRNENAFKLT